MGYISEEELLKFARGEEDTKPIHYKSGTEKHTVKIDPTELNKYHKLQYNYKLGTQEHSELMTDLRRIEEEMKTFTEEQLTSFGNYLLSEERDNPIIDSMRCIPNMSKSQLEEKLTRVSHADFENWKQKTSF